MTDKFADFLARSLELLEIECPDAYRAVCRKLADRSVSIEVDGATIMVRRAGNRLLTEPFRGPVAVQALASRDALLRLLDGEQMLTDAILRDEIVLRGNLDDLVQFYEGLLAYFHGAVRSPGFPRLLEQFLDSDDPGATLADT